MPRNVAVLVGSLRKDSLNRRMALAMAAIAPPELKLSIVEIGDLPLFNADHEAEPTAAVRAFKDGIAAADAVLFVTPEFNRSVPGARFDDKGGFAVEATRAFVGKYLHAFAAWIERNAA